MTNFSKVYPFTTEEISGYFPSLDLSGKSVLTVGSSGDQAFNALVHGAKNITLYDINPRTYEFFHLKKDIILNSKRDEVYGKVLQIGSVPFSSDLFAEKSLKKMNTYMQSDENYRLLQERLLEDNIDFVEGDIFDFDKSLGNVKYDRIIFSNILRYIDLFAEDMGYKGREYEFLKENFMKWIDHMNPDAILQLLYYYKFRDSYLNNSWQPVSTFNLPKVCETLDGYDLFLERFPCCLDSGEDAIVTYRK